MTPDPDHLFHKGKAAVKIGNLQHAVDLFLEVVETDDQHHLAWNALGVVYSKAGEYEDADICFKNALILAPDNPIYLQNRGRNNRKIKVLWERSEGIKKPSISQNHAIIIGIILVFLITIGMLSILLR
jgi:tetratricopeptide (TPR) repeat protein